MPSKTRQNTANLSLEIHECLLLLLAQLQMTCSPQHRWVLSLSGPPYPPIQTPNPRLPPAPPGPASQAQVVGPVRVPPDLLLRLRGLRQAIQHLHLASRATLHGSHGFHTSAQVGKHGDTGETHKCCGGTPQDIHPPQARYIIVEDEPTRMSMQHTYLHGQTKDVR